MKDYDKFENIVGLMTVIMLTVMFLVGMTVMANKINDHRNHKEVTNGRH